LWTKANSLDALSDQVLRLFFVNGIIFVGAIDIVSSSTYRVQRFLVASILLALVLAIDYIITGGLSHRGELEDRSYQFIGRVVSTGFIIFFVYMVFTKPLTKRWAVCTLGVITLFYAMLIIGARSSFIAMFAQILVVIFMAIYLSHRSIKIQLGVWPTALIIMLSAVVVVIRAQSGIEGWTLRRMNALFRFLGGDIQADSSARQRLVYIYAALNYWTDSWFSVLFGDGLFSFSQQYSGAYYYGVTPHNLIATILTEYGVVGLAIFVVLIVSLLVRSTFRLERGSALAAVLVALILGSAFRTLGSGDMLGTVMLLVYLSLLSALRAPIKQVPLSPDSPDGLAFGQPRAPISAGRS
jgi:hypothetical protein